jgi:hypothetical protein
LTQTALVIARDDLVDDRSYGARIGDRVQALSAHDVAHLGVDDLDRGHVSAPR